VFEFGEDLLDRVEIGALGRKKEEPCASGPDRGANGLALVAAEIGENDNIVWLQRGDEDLLDIEAEQLAIDRTMLIWLLDIYASAGVALSFLHPFRYNNRENAGIFGTAIGGY
jgi:hypothetical protein